MNSRFSGIDRDIANRLKDAHREAARRVQLDEQISGYSYGAGRDSNVEIRSLLHVETRGPRYSSLKHRY